MEQNKPPNLKKQPFWDGCVHAPQEGSCTVCEDYRICLGDWKERNEKGW